MKWIVFWVVVSINYIPCKQPEPIVSEFGIVNESNNILSIACFRTDTKNMSKEFDSLEAAQEFVDRGKKECGKGDTFSMGFTHGCSDFEIKELKPIK